MKNNLTASQLFALAVANQIVQQTRTPHLRLIWLLAPAAPAKAAAHGERCDREHARGEPEPDPIEQEPDRDAPHIEDHDLAPADDLIIKEREQELGDGLRSHTGVFERAPRPPRDFSLPSCADQLRSMSKPRGRGRGYDRSR